MQAGRLFAPSGFAYHARWLELHCFARFVGPEASLILHDVEGFPVCRVVAAASFRRDYFYAVSSDGRLTLTNGTSE